MEREVKMYLNQFQAERNAMGEKLMQALRDNMPWGLKVDLGNGQVAQLTPMNGDLMGSQPYRKPIYAEDADPIAEPNVPPIGQSEWRIIFDWKMTNCDQDHIEVTAEITGGGGAA